MILMFEYWGLMFSDRLIDILAPGILNKTKYFLARFYFAIARRIYRASTLPFFLKISFVYRDIFFDFYVKNGIDIDILIDTFVKEEYLLPGDIKVQTIFDLGSNIGATVIFFKILYPGATIYAFEPDPRNIVVLRKNIKQFGESIVVIEKAIVPTPSQMVTFYQADKTHWSSSLIPRDIKKQAITVHAITLDEAICMYKINHVDVCKFDIEGSEYNVFKKFIRKECISHLIGELHEDLMCVDRGAFIDLFPTFDLEKLHPNNIVYMRRKNI